MDKRILMNQESALNILGCFNVDNDGIFIDRIAILVRCAMSNCRSIHIITFNLFFICIITFFMTEN